MIWTAERDIQQSALVDAMYQQAAGMLCERKAVLSGGLPGASKADALAQAGVDPARSLTSASTGYSPGWLNADRPFRFPAVRVSNSSAGRSTTPGLWPGLSRRVPWTWSPLTIPAGVASEPGWCSGGGRPTYGFTLWALR
jgi:hypothetical protein